MHYTMIRRFAVELFPGFLFRFRAQLAREAAAKLLQKVAGRSAVGVSLPTDLHQFHYSGIRQLLQHLLLREDGRLLLVVRLDATVFYVEEFYRCSADACCWSCWSSSKEEEQESSGESKGLLSQKFNLDEEERGKQRFDDRNGNGVRIATSLLGKRDKHIKKKNLLLIDFDGQSMCMNKIAFDFPVLNKYRTKCGWAERILSIKALREARKLCDTVFFVFASSFAMPVAISFRRGLVVVINTSTASGGGSSLFFSFTWKEKGRNNFSTG